MKRFLLPLLLALVAPAAIAQPTGSACQYSTCVPVVNFDKTDLLQIYGAILTGATNGTIVSGNVGGFSTKHTVTLTTDGLYASGDCVGGKIQAADIMRPGKATAVLQDIEIWDNSNQKAPLLIDFWFSTPGGTFTDNAPSAPAGADVTYYLGTVQVTAANYITTGTVARATLTGLGLVLRGGSAAGTTRTFYITITTTGTPTYGANNSSLYLKLGILLD
jgi:hypothetical protein